VDEDPRSTGGSDEEEGISREGGEEKVGDIITVVVNEGKINSTPYLRAKVWLDLDKPLVRVVLITIKERMKYLVQYEKLPSFCFFCGCMGHEVTECRDGVHSKARCQWGDWLPFKLWWQEGRNIIVAEAEGMEEATGEVEEGDRFLMRIWNIWRLMLAKRKIKRSCKVTRRMIQRKGWELICKLPCLL